LYAGSGVPGEMPPLKACEGQQNLDTKPVSALQATVETIDPTALLQSGQPLAPEPELARILNVSRSALRWVLNGPGKGKVRHARRKPAPTMWCIAEARAVVEANRGAIEERRRRGEEKEAAVRAAAASRAAEKQEAHKVLLAKKAAKAAKPAAPSAKPAPMPPPSTRSATPSRGTSGPEIIIRRARVST
jgi:hypothetical protein